MSIIRKAINRMKPGEDIGLDSEGQRGRQRTINPDGSYNMDRVTGRFLGNFSLFHGLITTSWLKYWLVVFGFYSIMNFLFACVYFALGPGAINGAEGMDNFSRFFYCFFFSAQSFTTVGYGSLHPVTKMANVVATLEAFTGLMTFAIATGTLYGRFSKPVARIKYSPNIIISPFKGGTALQLMIANELSSTLMEMEAKLNLSWMEQDGSGQPMRKFQQVKLEFDKIAMFPTSWVINHPIDEESILSGKTEDEIKLMDVEVFVLLKGFDDVFSQTIYSRHSYMSSQFVFGAKFARPFFVNENGKLVMDLTRVGVYERAELPNQLSSTST